MWRLNELTHVVLSNMPNTHQAINFCYLLILKIKTLFEGIKNQEKLNLFNAVVLVHKQYQSQLCCLKKNTSQENWQLPYGNQQLIAGIGQCTTQLAPIIHPTETKLGKSTKSVEVSTFV